MQLQMLVKNSKNLLSCFNKNLIKRLYYFLKKIDVKKSINCRGKMFECKIYLIIITNFLVKTN